MKRLFNALPWWVRWLVLPVLGLFVFGSLLVKLVTLVVSVAFWVLLAAAAVALLIFAVRKFLISSSSRGGGW